MKPTESSWWGDLTQPHATLLASLAVLSSAGIAFAAAWLTHQREREAARQERYTTIATQLADKSGTVRLAGIYALEALANEWQQARQGGQRDVAVELLCAYLRAPRRKGGDKEARSAIVTIFRLHSNLWIRRMGLGNHWVRRLLSRGLRETRVLQAPWPSDVINLENADLIGARFNNIDFRSSHLMGANLAGALLMASDLRKANMSGVSLSGAFLWRADVRGTDLSGAYLGTAGFDEASFRKPPNIKGEDKGPIIKWDSSTKWPSGFDIEEAIRRQADKDWVPPSI